VEKAPEMPPVESEEVAEEAKAGKLKILGKIDLDKKKTPAKQAVKEEAAEEEKAGEPVVADRDQKEPVAGRETSEQPEAVSDKKAEKPGKDKEVEKEGVFKTQFKKLEGPTILGKMDLPRAQGGCQEACCLFFRSRERPRKRKRKRIKKERPAEGQVAAGDKAAQDPSKGRRVGKRDHVKPELTEEEISRQIRETLASLSGTGKSKASKHRRLKRDHGATAAGERNGAGSQRGENHPGGRIRFGCRAGQSAECIGK
jgi:translation initiation factor IF-2